MILVLGGTGYIGAFIVEYLRQCEFDYVAPQRGELNVFSQHDLFEYIDQHKCDFIVNAVGYTGQPNVEACEFDKLQCYLVNVLLPHTLEYVCTAVGIPWGHVSSGCIFNGYDKTFDEDDIPNFSFDVPPCSWYSGTKAHGEIAAGSNCYIWRIRMPMSTVNCPRNYLNKLMTYDKILVAKNSITWVEQFVSNLPLFWEFDIPYGVYNMVSSDAISSRDIHAEFAQHSIGYSTNYVELSDFADMVNVPRSNCILSNNKSVEAGVRWSNAIDAVRECLDHRVYDMRHLSYRRLGLCWNQRF